MSAVRSQALVRSESARPRASGRNLVLMYAFLIALNTSGWLGTLFAARSHPTLLGLGALAYGFGLRHAVDPDHIAAIDNTTRKLMQDGKQPVATGFFFSLGHSTIVFVLCVVVAISASAIHRDLPKLQPVTSVIGTSVSCLFLLLIGLINAVALIQVIRAWRQTVKGTLSDESAAQGFPHGQGLLSRLFRSLLFAVRHSWQLYPIGFLFGLGFDTASEVALLGIAASSGTNGIPLWGILLLPLLFTAGMSLVDTSDGILMLRAYGWAYLRPARKLYYNMSITGASVMIALFIGGLEGLQVFRQTTNATGPFWGAVGNLQIGSLGVFIVGAFVVSWAVSALFYKVRRYDLLDAVR